MKSNRRTVNVSKSGHRKIEKIVAQGHRPVRRARRELARNGGAL